MSRCISRCLDGINEELAAMTVGVGAAALVRDVLMCCLLLLSSCILHTFVTYHDGLHGYYIFWSLVHRHGSQSSACSQG